MNKSTNWQARRLAPFLLVFATFIPLAAQNQDNGIHVAAPKVYDARALQLMMDELAQSLKKTSFVDPKTLAGALGNVQGFNATDFSQTLNLNGAVGPQAAAVFAGAGGTPAPAPSASPASPGVTINVAPTVNAGASTPAAGTPSGVGPQPPALPSLQTGPTFNPTFGPSGGDLLADEANLTYQLFNLRMMLERSLNDRLLGDQARLQAVLGFDIDIEPSSAARDAVAVVDVAVHIDCTQPRNLPGCDQAGGISIVALMPEEGSHNAATLSQKASGFGGALASAVFSVGYSAQKRSQVFYLYRDLDTVSFELPASAGDAHFGWQFRPVLGRHAVTAGKRHLLVVLSLPAPDEPGEENYVPELVANVSTSWRHYDSKLQTTFPGHLWSHNLPTDQALTPPFHFDVPSTAHTQHDLHPRIDFVKWVQTDPANGVVIVSGKNFFPGTTVRFGNKTYSSASDGLIIKSDHELEVAVPSATVALGGVLSGRYGPALAIEGPAPAGGIEINELFPMPIGNFLYNVEVDLRTRLVGGVRPSFSDVRDHLNPPIVLLNGIPVAVQPTFNLDGADPSKARLLFPAPADSFSAATVVTVIFPFDGPRWSESMPYYETTLRVARLPGPDQSELVITATNPAAQLCTGWTLTLDPAHSFTLGNGLTCLDPSSNALALRIGSDDLQKYKRLVLTHAARAPLVAEIPKSDAPSPQPVVDNTATAKQYDVKAVEFRGKYLDKVTKVLFEKTSLDIVTKEKGKIVISLTKEVTEKPRASVDLQLLSDGNDPVIAHLTITPNPDTKGK